MTKSNTIRRFLGKHPKAGEKTSLFDKKELRGYLKGEKIFHHNGKEYQVRALIG